MTAEVLAFSKPCGNGLSTPQPAFGFPGRRPRGRSCLCAERWKEAYEAGKAPRGVPSVPHEATLDMVSMNELRRFALDLA